LSHKFHNITQELRATPHWVLWKLEDRDGKPSKIPHSIHGGGAKTNDPATWAPFNDTLAAYEHGGYDGVGFVLTDTPFVGIDLDKCVGSNDEWEIDPTRAVGMLGSYAEYSVSGKGIHIIARGKLPPHGRRKGSVEMYETGRYFCMTGNRANDAPIRECQSEIDAVHAKYIAGPERERAPEPPPRRAEAPTGGYTEVLDKARRAKNGPAFAALYDRGDISAYNGDDSGADLALCNLLAFWTGRDAVAIDRLFRTSALMRPKWDARRGAQTYGERTIAEAVAGCRETYEPGDNYGVEFDPPPEAEAKREHKTFYTITASDLLSQDLGEVRFFVKNFLHQGLGVLCADPKTGKSWLALDLCLSIATGRNFWNYETVQCGVLYLALEDSWRRLQDRIRKINRSAAAPSNFYLAITASALDNGLADQIFDHMKTHPDTGVIVVDVFDHIRSGTAPRNKNAYQIDSAEVAKIKRIADSLNICILLIHHTTKARANTDPFLNISGSQGILAGVDEGMIIEKEKREDTRATLSLISREMGDEKYVIEFDRSTCRWQYIETLEEEQAKKDRREYDNDPVVKTIKGLLNMSPLGIEITAREFADQMPTFSDSVTDEKTVGHAFKRLRTALYDNDKIIHTPGKSNLRKHSFRRAGRQTSFTI